jgi:hypothetical protein
LPIHFGCNPDELAKSPNGLFSGNPDLAKKSRRDAEKYNHRGSLHRCVSAGEMPDHHAHAGEHASLKTFYGFINPGFHINFNRPMQ